MQCAATRRTALPRFPDLMHRAARCPIARGGEGIRSRTFAANGRAPVIRYDRERHHDEHAA
ncbi:hypothetical protein WT36_27750 [Burkholderia territorii]|nr:hypothetical protein WT36_27750 [Burkholderia territorii]